MLILSPVLHTLSLAILIKLTWKSEEIYLYHLGRSTTHLFLIFPVNSRSCCGSCQLEYIYLPIFCLKNLRQSVSVFCDSRFRCNLVQLFYSREGTLASSLIENFALIVLRRMNLGYPTYSPGDFSEKR